MSEAGFFAEHKERIRSSSTAVVHGEGEGWIAYDHPIEGRRTVAISSENGQGVYAVDMRISPWPHERDMVIEPAISALAKKWQHAEALAKEAFEAFPHV